jgi:hypothetical protein
MSASDRRAPLLAVCASLAAGALASGALASGALTGGPPVANGETGSPGTTENRSGCEASASVGEPAKVSAGVGAFQSTPVETGFPLRLAVTVTNGEQKPAPGVPVTFTAPVSGPSGWFATGGRGHRPRRVQVRTDACGIAVAPAFTANARQGGYIVTATVAHVRPAAFALVNAGPERQP